MFGRQSNEVKGGVQEGMTLEQVRKAMLELMAEENTNHYRMGQLYNYVVNKKLAEGAGYKDAQDYFSKTLADLSQSALTMYGVVAKSFSEEVSVRFGVTCLYLLLTYKEVADLKVNHEEPGGTVIEVPAENGEVTSKLFSACSVDEMRRAIRRKRKPSSSKRVCLKGAARPLQRPGASAWGPPPAALLPRGAPGCSPQQCPHPSYRLRAVVLRHLERLGERAQGLDIPLDAHVPEDEERGAHGRLAQRRVGRNEEGDAELGLDAVGEQVDDLDMEVGDVEVACERRGCAPRPVNDLA